MHAFTILAALAATASAIPFVKRAGGPGPGAGNYPIVGTKLRVAVLQPWGNDYLASNYTVDPACTAAWIQQYQEQPSTELTFVTTNVTDAAGYTGVALNAPGYGLEVTDGGVRVEPGATMADFYLQHGYLWNTASPRGFYCGCSR